MDNFEHRTQVNSCCLTLLLFSRKGAVHVLYARMHLTTHKWEDLDDLRVLRKWVAIEETVESILV